MLYAKKGIIMIKMIASVIICIVIMKYISVISSCTRFKRNDKEYNNQNFDYQNDHSNVFHDIVRLRYPVQYIYLSPPTTEREPLLSTTKARTR